MNTRFFPTFALLVCILYARSTFASPTIKWYPFNIGLDKAASEKKYVYIDIYADWCSYCQVMEKTTFKNSMVINELSKNFISIKLDADSKDSISWENQTVSVAQFSNQIGAVGLPFMLFLNNKREIIGSFPYFADEKTLLNLLTYISSGARERNETLDEFLGKPN